MKKLLQERLMANIKFDTTSKCWEWQAAKSKAGYGYIDIDGKTKRAHRVSYEFFYGTDPGSLFVCHKCDNISCINPDHLFLGTHQDNMDDRNAKGRQSRTQGTKSGSAKLSEAQVLEIRASTETHRTLAKKYGVVASLISLIKTRKRWTHI